MLVPGCAGTWQTEAGIDGGWKVGVEMVVMDGFDRESGVILRWVRLGSVGKSALWTNP
jgi:hypothetical protein